MVEERALLERGSTFDGEIKDRARKLRSECYDGVGKGESCFPCYCCVPTGLFRLLRAPCVCLCVMCGVCTELERHQKKFPEGGKDWEKVGRAMKRILAEMEGLEQSLSEIDQQRGSLMDRMKHAKDDLVGLMSPTD